MISTLQLWAVAPSTTNPRKHFDEATLAELAESIRQHGVIQPILVRPLPSGSVSVSEDLSQDKKAFRVWVGNPGATKLDLTGRLSKKDAEAARDRLKDATYQLVAGERRMRAAKAAGLTEIPAIVRDMDDRTMLEVQVIENLQRADLHPLEEAEGYSALMIEHGYTADDLAAKVGKSKAYIYGRMKLSALSEKCREALYKNELSHSVALLLARIPHAELQDEALDAVGGDDWSGPMPFRQASQTIQRQFMLRLKDAPFDTKADLPGGPCAQCPKRTGNQKELFEDVDCADVCTDPKCFNAKRDEFTRLKLEAAKTAGQTVLETKQAFSEYNQVKGDYVDLKDRCTMLGFEHDDDWHKTLGKKCPQPILSVDANGEIHELITKDEARVALKATGRKPKESDFGGSGHGEDEKKRAKKKKEMQARAFELAPQILDALVKERIDADAWRHLADAVAQLTGIDVHAFIAKRRGWCTSQADAHESLEKWLTETQDAVELQRFVVEALLCARYSEGWDPKWSDEFKAVCELASVSINGEPAKKNGQTKAKKGKKK